MNTVKIVLVLFVLLMLLFWLLGLPQNAQLAEKDLLALLSQGQVRRIDLKLLDFRPGDLTKRHMEDQVDFFQGGKATFQVANSQGKWGDQAAAVRALLRRLPGVRVHGRRGAGPPDRPH